MTIVKRISEWGNGTRIIVPLTLSYPLDFGNDGIYGPLLVSTPRLKNKSRDQYRVCGPMPRRYPASIQRKCGTRRWPSLTVTARRLDC